MVFSCCVKGCRSESYPGCGLSFHSFPVKEDALKAWLKVVPVKGSTKYKKVCSNHFKSQDFVIQGARKRLTANAVPSVLVTMPMETVKVISNIQIKPPNIMAHQDVPANSMKIDICYEPVPNTSSQEITLRKRPLSDLSPSLNIPQSNKRKCVAHKYVQTSRGKENSQIKREVNILKQKLKRRDLKITSMKNLLSVVKKRTMHYEDIESIIRDHFCNIYSEFKPKNKSKISPGVRYSKELKQFALTLKYYSPRAYRFLRTCINLPHPATIRKMLSSAECNVGFLKEVFEFLKLNVQTNPALIHVALIFDSMAIKSELVYEKNSDKTWGYVDLGGIENVDSYEVAKESLIFQIVSYTIMSGGHLVVLDRAGREVKQFTLSSGLATLGSDPSCDIRILLPTVHPHHATVAVHTNQTVVRNVGAGETLVNGVAVSVAALREGDELALGGRRLRWRYARPAPHHARTRPPEPALQRVKRSRGGAAASLARLSEHAPRAPQPHHRDSMPAALSTRQVAIVQPQRRDTADHIEAVSSPVVSIITNVRRPRTPKTEEESDISIDTSEEEKDHTKQAAIMLMAGHTPKQKSSPKQKRSSTRQKGPSPKQGSAKRASFIVKKPSPVKKTPRKSGRLSKNLLSTSITSTRASTASNNLSRKNGKASLDQSYKHVKLDVATCLKQRNIVSEVKSFKCSDMAHQIHLNENEIACALQCDLSEDGLDLDDDSLMDPDFEPDFEESIDESLEAEFDIDALVDTLNDDDRNSNFEVEVGPALSSSDIPEIESGKENVVRPDEPDLGASSNVVVRLSRMIPRHQNYRLYFDNYFTSLHLLEYLAKEGILGLGTIRRNRIPDCKLSSEKEIMKKDRGYSEEYIADVNSVDVSTVVWKDNKLVTLASTFAGLNPISEVRRYDKKNSRYINIPRPNVVSEYNRHMGGVDLVDSIMGIYKIKLRSKRWQMRLFYHFLDLTMANAWLFYKRVCKYKNIPNKTIMASADFRLEIAETLCKMGVKTGLTIRRSIEGQILAKKHKGPAQHVPPQAVRQDQVGHWPQWAEKKIRCKFPKCAGFTHTASMMEITDSDVHQTVRESDVSTHSGVKSLIRSPLLPSPKKSALKDPTAKKSARKTESIKFDLSNLENSGLNSVDVLMVTDTTNKSFENSASEDELTLHYSESSTAKSPSPRRSIHSRSSKIMERTLGTTFIPDTESVQDTLTPLSPKSRKSSRGSVMLQKVLQTPDNKKSLTYSRRATKSLTEKSWNSTAASLRRTRTLSPRDTSARDNMEAYSIVDLVSIDSNDSRSASVYNSASSADTSTSKFGTPHTTAGRKTSSIRGRSLLASSTPAMKSDYKSRVSRSQSYVTSRSYDSIQYDSPAQNSVISTRKSKSLSTPDNVTFNISGRLNKSKSLATDSDQDNITINSTRKSRQSRSYNSLPIENSKENATINVTESRKSVPSPKDATFNVSRKSRMSKSVSTLENSQDNITLDSSRKSRKSRSISTPEVYQENITLDNSRHTRSSRSSHSRLSEVSVASPRSSKRSVNSNTNDSPLQNKGISTPDQNRPQEVGTPVLSTKSRKSVTSPKDATFNVSRKSRRAKSVLTLENSQDNITLDSSRKSRKSKSISTPEVSQENITLDSSRHSESLRSNHSRLSKVSVASPRSSKRSVNSNTNDSPLQNKGTSTPDQNSPQEVGTPVLSIRSLLDSSQDLTMSHSKEKGIVRVPVKVLRKTVGGRPSVPRKGVSSKSKSLSLGTRVSLRRSLKNSPTYAELNKYVSQDEGESTPKSAVKLVQETVKNKHSSAKKPKSKRSIIDHLNESDMVKQLFNSPVKRKLSQSMMEFSRKQLLEEDTTPPRRPTRNTIALTGRTPEISILERSQAFTPEVFVSPLSTPSNSSNVTSLERLFTEATPENELRNVTGAKKLLHTPRYRRSVKNDLSKVSGVKSLFKRSPRNRLSDVRVKELFAVSPNNDLRRVSNVKTLFQSQKEIRSPKNSLEDVAGVRKLFKKNSPGNDLGNVSRVKTILRRNSPKNDLSDVRGLRRLFRQEKQRDDSNNLSGIEELFSESHQTSNLPDANLESSFDLLIGKPAVRSYPKAKSFSNKLIQKPKIRKARSLQTSFSSITDNVEDWLETELRKRMHKYDISEPSSKLGTLGNKSNDSTLSLKSGRSTGNVSLSRSKRLKDNSKNKSNISTSLTRGKKSANIAQKLENTVTKVNKSKDVSKTKAPINKSKTVTEETPTNVNISKTKTNLTRELQKLMTDTVDGNSPVLTSRIRNSTLAKTSLVEEVERKKSASEIYGAHTLPIKKRSLIDTSANKSSEKSVLPIKKRVLMHSTPVKSRINFTMNASEIGRVSPIAPVNEVAVDVDKNQDTAVRSIELPKESPKRKTIQTRKSKIIQGVVDSQISSKAIQLSPKNKEKAQRSPVQVRATRGRRVKESLEVNSSVVISKKPPVLKNQTTAKVSRNEPVSVGNPEPVVQVTRKRNFNRKQGLVEEVTENVQPATKTTRRKNVQEVESPKRSNKATPKRKSGRKTNLSKDNENATIDQLSHESPPKTRTRRQKVTGDKVQTPKANTRAKVRKLSVVITKPSPQMKPRSGKQGIETESQKIPEKTSQRTRRTIAQATEAVEVKQKKQEYLDEISEESQTKRRGRNGKLISPSAKVAKKGQNVVVENDPKGKNVTSEAEANLKPKRGRKTIAQTNVTVENNVTEVRTRSTRITTKTDSATTQTRGKKTASYETTQAVSKRQMKAQNSVIENTSRGGKTKITAEETPSKLRKMDVADDTGTRNRGRRGQNISKQQNIETTTAKSPVVVTKGRRGKKTEDLQELDKQKTIENEVLASKRVRGGKKTEGAPPEVSQLKTTVGRKKNITNTSGEVAEPKSTRGKRSQKQSVDDSAVTTTEVKKVGKGRAKRGAGQNAPKNAQEVQETTKTSKAQKEAGQDTEGKNTRRKKVTELEKPQPKGRKRKNNMDVSAAEEPAKPAKNPRKTSAVSPKAPARETRTRRTKVEDVQKPAARSRRR
ncbi:unnamed protein product [Parnassius apollo]|uniref:(apollo) hypothetical protein n=1 Tax=Parnassius apollo TaxID=110799 RepID=A0A8S3W7L5_PARAO|nr:unnamed protein product [Parnassius apollo]